MSSEDALYEIDIKTETSPSELKDFVELLEAEGYHVVTDLQHGKMRVKSGVSE